MNTSFNNSALQSRNPVWSFVRLAAIRFTAIAGTLALMGRLVEASTIYWNGVNGGAAPNAGWNLSTNWAANSDGTGVATIPGVGDTAVLSISTSLAGQVINLDASQSILGLQIQPNQGAMTISSGPGTNTLTLGTGGITIGAGAGTTTLNAGIVLNGNQSWQNSGGTLLFNGALSGTGNLTVSGNFNATNGSANLTGTVTLTGQSDVNGNFLNGISGGTIISTGTIGVQGGTMTVNKSITFTGNTNWYTNGNSSVLSGSVTGGAMISNGTGNLTLSGSTDNTGLSVSTPGGTTLLAKASSSTVHAIGTSLTLAGGSTTQITGTGGDQIKDSATVSIGALAIFDLNGNSEAINTLTGSGAVTNTLAFSNSTFTLGAGNGTASFSGAIQDGSGVVNLTKTGTGTQSLTGANTYTGTTTVNRGTLKLDFTGTNTGASVLSSSSALVLGGGALSVLGTNTAAQTTSQAVNGVTINPGSSSIVNTVGAAGLSSTLALGGISRTAGGGTVDFTLPATGSTSTTTANSNFAGGQQTIIGGYATVSGSGWAVSGTGATAGAISALGTYNAGFAAGKDVDAAATTSTPAAMTINSLRFNTAGASTVNTAGNLVVATGGILETTTVGASAVAINNNTITSGNGRDLIVIQNNSNATGVMTIGSAIVDNGGTSIGLTKSGAGSLVLSGANTYTGATNLNGAVTVNNTSTLGSNSAVTLNGTGAVTFANTGAQINLSSIGATATASSNNGPAANAIDGNIGTRWETASSDPQWIRIDLKSVYNLGSAAISWETAGGKNFVIQTGDTSASATPDGTNTNGWTTVSTTTNQASYNDKHFITYAFTPGASGQFVDVYGTLRNTGFGYSIWELNLFQAAAAVTQNIGSLASSDATTSVSLATLVTLSTGGDNTSTSFAGAITGTGNLTKVGNGSQTLAGANTYTGTTTVSAGTLILSGSISGTTSNAGNANVAATGTLAGTGALVMASGNRLTVAGTLAPGNPTATTKTGIFNVTETGASTTDAPVAGQGSLNLAAGATLSIKLGATSAGGSNAAANAGLDDVVNVTGTISLDGASILSGTLLNGFTAATNDLFFIAINNGTDAITGIFAGLAQGAFVTFTGPGGSRDFSISYTADSTANGGLGSFTGGNDIALMVVPEPGTWGTLVGGFGMLLGFQRLRRRQAGV